MWINCHDRIINKWIVWLLSHIILFTCFILFWAFYLGSAYPWFCSILTFEIQSYECEDFSSNGCRWFKKAIYSNLENIDQNILSTTFIISCWLTIVIVNISLFHKERKLKGKLTSVLLPWNERKVVPNVTRTNPYMAEWHLSG